MKKISEVKIVHCNLSPEDAMKLGMGKDNTTDDVVNEVRKRLELPKRIRRQGGVSKWASLAPVKLKELGLKEDAKGNDIKKAILEKYEKDNIGKAR